MSFLYMFLIDLYSLKAGFSYLNYYCQTVITKKNNESYNQAGLQNEGELKTVLHEAYLLSVTKNA